MPITVSLLTRKSHFQRSFAYLSAALPTRTAACSNAHGELLRRIATGNVFVAGECVALVFFFYYLFFIYYRPWSFDIFAVFARLMALLLGTDSLERKVGN